MPDRVVLIAEESTVHRPRPRRGRITAPYAGARAHLHLYASEIAVRLRETVTDARHPHALDLIATDFQSDHAVIDIAGAPTAVDHWLADHRLITTLQTVVNAVHDERLPEAKRGRTGPGRSGSAPLTA
jgi:hypothetical protein